MEPDSQPPADPVLPQQVPEPSESRDYKKLVYVLLILAMVMVVAAVSLHLLGNMKAADQAATAYGKSLKTQPQNSSTKGLQLDSSKNYGDKYANGLLPVGDNKYVTTGAQKGYVYACSGYAQNLKTSSGGAGSRGPWFVGTTQYDINKKAHVQGSKLWQAEFSNKIAGGTRTIITNDLPTHPTGVFPISAGDPAYAYDKNPNSIKGQTFTYSLSAEPSYGAPQCLGGQVGVMLTGVALFSGFDAGGRDAGAWEVQDSCSGHPEKSGTYHYHTLSSCIKDISVKTVIGFALDGFPITGPKVGNNNILTTSDLDECHGLTSQIILDGKNTTMYHYVMTQDFPYSASCFRAAAIQPPGQQGATDRQTHPGA